MIIPTDLLNLIKAGKKTMHRTPTRDNEPTCRYQAGRAYAVQPSAGQPADIKITIIDQPRQARLGDITAHEARREGYRHQREYLDAWRTRHGHLDLDQPVWVLAFVLGDQTDTPRLLAANPGGQRNDYVTQPARAMKGEPEAIPAMLADQYSREAHGRDTARTTSGLRERADRILTTVAEIRSIDGIDKNTDSKLRAVERNIRSIAIQRLTRA